MKRHRIMTAVIALLLSIVMLFGMTAIAFADRQSPRLYKGEFSYSGRTDTFYYSDGYFTPSGNEENEHLRTISAAVAFSAAGNGGQGVVDLMTDIGMDTESIAIEEMEIGTRDTIGTVIAHKMIGETPLVLVAIRGNDYDGEWASNLLAGADGDAAGIAAAAAKVSDRLQTYLSQQNITKAKIWVCGYSRAGGVANLLGKAMNEAPADYHTHQDNIYVYTFEAPRCSADDKVYPNIRNIMDINDVVPRMYPEAWGLCLNGVTEKIGDPADTVMTKRFHIATEGYIKDYVERPKHEFLSQFEDFIGTTISREVYASSYEQHISDLTAIYFSKTEEEQAQLISYFEKVGELVQDYPLLNIVILNLMANPASEGNINTVSNLLSGWLDEARESENPPLTDEEYTALKDAVRPLVTMALTLADVDMDYYELDSRGRKVYLNLFHLVTFLVNLTEFIGPHYCENVFELLKAEDTYYTLGVRITPGDVYYGKWYTYAEYGGTLMDLAIDLGFTEEDVTVLKNGYDIRIDTDITEIAEPDQKLYLQAAGVLDKSMKMLSFYDISVTKTLGYRTEPVKLKKNLIMHPIPQQIGERASRFAVVQVNDDSAVKLDQTVLTTADGGTALRFNCLSSAVYATAYDRHNHYLIGDVDRDVDVTTLDVTHILRSMASIETFGYYQNHAGDVDGDEDVSVLDATWMLRWLADMPVPLEIDVYADFPD